jgi:hypothetical protein
MSARVQRRELVGRGKNLDGPALDWLRPDRARFHYLPAYTPPGEPWCSAVARTVRAYSERLFADWEMQGSRLRVGNVVLELSSDLFCIYGIRSLEHWKREPGETVCDDSSLLCGSPHENFWLCDGCILKPEYRVNATSAFHFTEYLRASYTGWFEGAVQRGYAHIMAMPQTPLAPFCHIHWERWRYFRITDEDNWIAEGPEGEKLYNVYIAPGSVENTVIAPARQALGGAPGKSYRDDAIAYGVMLLAQRGDPEVMQQINWRKADLIRLLGDFCARKDKNPPSESTLKNWANEALRAFRSKRIQKGSN